MSEAKHVVVRQAEYVAGIAALALVGARLRIKYDGDDERWSDEEQAEWDAACEPLDALEDALTADELGLLDPAEMILAKLCRGETLAEKEIK